MQKYPEVGICNPKIYFAKGFEYHKERVYREKEKGNVFGMRVGW